MYLTVDIGGTKTFIALFDARGHIVKADKFPTDHNLNAFLNTFFNHLEPFQNPAPTNIVVAVAGLVKNNHPTWFGNLPWQKPPLEKTIKKLFNCPIFFLNDADLACYYEAHFYQGKTIYLTFSTGIGGGIATTKKLSNPKKSTKPGHKIFIQKPDYQTVLNSASATFEPGHQTYNFNGKMLEWEDFAAASAIKKAYDNRDVTSLSSKSALLDIALRVSVGLIDIINEHHPDTIVLGGPLALTYKKWRLPLKIILKTSLEKNQKAPKIHRAKRPNLCVSYGAYLYGKNLAKNRGSRG